MPRTIPSGLRTWLDRNPLLESHSTLEVALPLSEDATTYYYSTTGAVYLNGHAYDRALKEIGELKLSLGSSADRIEIRLDNSDGLQGNIFLSSPDALRQNRVKVGRIYYNPEQPSTQYHQVLFQGTITSVQELDAEVQLSVVSDLYAGGQVGGTRLVSKTCQSKFKDPNLCAYSGAGTVCSKLLDDATGGCEFYANQHHFAGFVYIDSKAVQQTVVGGPPAVNQLIKSAGTAFQQRNALDFLSGATVEDDPTNDRTKVTVTGTPPRVFKDATEITPNRPKFLLKEGLTGRDNATEGKTELRTFRVPTHIYNLVTEYGAVGYAGESLGTINASTNTLTVTAAPGHWSRDNGILIAGAGPSGADLITKITDVSTDGLTVTLQDNASTNVINANVRHDETAALQLAINNGVSQHKGHIFLPDGFYVISSTIQLPQMGEGNAITIEGAGIAGTTILYQGMGSLFEGPQGQFVDGLTIKDISLATSTPGDPYSVRPFVNDGSGIDLTGCSVVNVITLRNVRFAGWGRWGFIGDNCQGCWFENLWLRANSAGGLALVSDNTVWAAAKENNVCKIDGFQVDYSGYIPEADANYTGGGMAASSNVFTGSGFTSGMRGRLIRIAGAGIAGGDVIAYIKRVLSSTQLQLSYTNPLGTLSGLAYTVEKINCASIYLHRSSHSSLISGICQGNYSGSIYDVPSLRVENTGGLRISQLWTESTGGSAAFDIELLNCSSVLIEGHHSNADVVSTPGENAGGNYKGVGTDSVVLRGITAPNPTAHFNLDANCWGWKVESGTLSTPDNVFNQFDQSVDGIEVADQVTYAIDAAGGVNPTSAHRGTLNLNDEYLAGQWVTTPRFIDDGAGALAGWTDSHPTWHSVVHNGYGRYDHYLLINTQGLSDGSVGLMAYQNIPIPDSYAVGPVTFGYDLYIENFGASPVNNREVSIAVVGTNGARGYGELKFKAQNSQNVAAGKWMRIQYQLYVGAGTSRNFQIQIFSATGPNNPRVRLANFRMHGGKHVAASPDEPITELRGGLLRAPLTVNAALNIAPTGSIVFKEAVGSGGNKVTLLPPDNIASDFSLKMPEASGNLGDALTLASGNKLVFSAAASTFIDAKRDYAAVGDGSANDTAAIKDAITEACATGGAVYLPAGTYMVNVLNTISGSVRIFGDGPGRTILKARVTGESVIEVTGQSLNNFTLEEMTIEGFGSGSGHGIYFHANTYEPFDLTFRNLIVKNCGGNGVYLAQHFSTLLERVHASNCGENGIELQGNNTCRLVNCYWDSVPAGKAGLRIWSGRPLLEACNGVDSAGSWAVFGRKVSEDGADNYCFPTLIGCNIEGFGLGANNVAGIRVKNGFANFFGCTFLAGGTGTNLMALLLDFVDPTWAPILDASCQFYTPVGTSQWKNSQPVHSSGAPFAQFGSVQTTYYDTSASATRSLPTMMVNLVAGSTNIATILSRAKITALEASALVGDLTGGNDFAGNAARLLLKAGTAGRPAVVDVDNNTTGIYYGTQEVAISIAGTAKYNFNLNYFRSLPAVGIGKFPGAGYALDIAGKGYVDNTGGGGAPTWHLYGGTNPHLYVEDPTNSIALRVGTLVGDTNRGIVGTMTNHSLWFYQDSNPYTALHANGNFVHGTAALATNATNGFFYLPGMPGTPTGTPTAFTGCVPITIDTANNRLYGYFGGAWVNLTGSGGGGGGAQIDSGVYGSRPTGSEDDVYFATDGHSVSRKGSSAWVEFGPIHDLILPGVESGWTEINKSGGATAATMDDQEGALRIRAPYDSGDQVRALVKSAPGSTPWTVTALLRTNLWASDYNQAGLILRESSSGKLIAFEQSYISGSWKLRVNRWDSPTSGTSGGTVFDHAHSPERTIWMRIKDDGTNRIYYWSVDGRNFMQVHSESRTAHMTANQIGFFANSATSIYAIDIQLLSWEVT